MKANICYGLLKRYDNIVSVFTDDENNDVAIIEKTKNSLWYETRRIANKERYLITFNFLTSPCLVGETAHYTLEEAEKEVKRLRPKAILVR
jgi:hypothetical protein